jgi:anti-sigma B factor antagonist
MGLNITTLDQVTVVELSGDLDSKTAPPLQEQLLPLAKDDNCKLILDMSRVEYMSSAGLRMLLAVRRQIPISGHVVLLGLPEAIRGTMAITGFLDFFTTCATITEARQAMQK